MYNLVPEHLKLSAMRSVVLSTRMQGCVDEIEAAKIALDASSKACIEHVRGSGVWSADLEEMARADWQRYVKAFEELSHCFDREEHGLRAAGRGTRIPSI